MGGVKGLERPDSSRPSGGGGGVRKQRFAWECMLTGSVSVASTAGLFVCAQP